MSKKPANQLICGICEQPITEGQVDMDHIIPKSYGGPSAQWNLRPAHNLCNKKRQNRIESFQLPFEAAKRGFHSKEPQKRPHVYQTVRGNRGRKSQT